MKEGCLLVEDTKLAFTDSSAGEPAVVLIHGFTTNLTAWADIIPHLTHGLRVVTVNLPRHGQMIAVTAEVEATLVSYGIPWFERITRDGPPPPGPSALNPILPA